MTEMTETHNPNPILPVYEFMKLAGQIPPQAPGARRENQFPELQHFVHRVSEEVQETTEAINNTDLPETLDGFIDIAYSAITGAIAAVGWQAAYAAWNAVCEANLRKVDGTHGALVVDETTGKVKKPEGWEPPNIAYLTERLAHHPRQDLQYPTPSM